MEISGQHVLISYVYVRKCMCISTAPNNYCYLGGNTPPPPPKGGDLQRPLSSSHTLTQKSLLSIPIEVEIMRVSGKSAGTPNK